jgi:hypothetical protein
MNPLFDRWPIMEPGQRKKPIQDSNTGWAFRGFPHFEVCIRDLLSRTAELSPKIPPSSNFFSPWNPCGIKEKKEK